MDTRLLLADRMAGMGMLAAAVVHELNAPLGFTIANIDYAVESLQSLESDLADPPGVDDPEARARFARAYATLRMVVEALREAKEGGDRVRRIVRDLRTFSGPEHERRVPIDVRRVLESAIAVAYGEIRNRARLVKDYGPVPLVEGNESHLGQIFLNLLVNAAQAIREGSIERDQIRVATRTDERGRCVVEVSDTGHGIAPDDLGRIFEPFFTTKQQRSGTGLGLSICQNLVTSMGGEMSVESEVGRGSLFCVMLPAAVDSTVGRRSVVSPPRTAPRGRILVVDDEPMMARAVQRLLDPEHDVVTTSDPRQAVELVLGGARFDAILCDLMMPIMTGMEVHDAIERADREQARRMVFMTGGAFTPRAAQFLESVDNPRIDKPIEYATLRAVLRMHLTAPPPR